MNRYDEHVDEGADAILDEIEELIFRISELEPKFRSVTALSKPYLDGFTGDVSEERSTVGEISRSLRALVGYVDHYHQQSERLLGLADAAARR